jgi:hypothetical protein
MKLDNVEQCVVPANNRSDLEIQFAEPKDKTKDCLIQIVFNFAKKKPAKAVENEEDEEEEEEEEEESMADQVRQKIADSGIMKTAAGDVLVEFNREQGNFLAPRGKYDLKVLLFYATVLFYV